MTDTDKFIAYIKERGISFTKLAEGVGMTRESLYHKVKNETEFKASEIVKITNFLRLTNAEREEIFFRTEVE